MNFVQPIRDPECIFYIKRFLKEQSERNYMLFVTGINSGLRISDILELRVRDAKRPYFNLIEKKTKKKKRIDMTPELQRELKAYIEGKEDHEYLFKSREGINKPISRSMAYKILRAAAEYVNLDDIGTHTLRKTFGYHFYKQTKDVAMLQEIFNHSDQRTTLRYIGINQDAMNNAMKKFKI
ncbi:MULTISPECIES: tyrosine-type recombinase/integrase [Bacillus amyloliquefaciens group]|uniref:tyrosine-type recombinase/integrase n=1 Tax=Bacillus amyloliquefaciens group TaxID=1938374 RepID=UPI00064C5654|nr:tyrosine-type recombinase/integrase [Bacillus velezensis]AKL77796.1 site-specific recombinase, phage integrase [Bacillus velezensis]AZJ43662.1 site-specific integrase [Bacillus velezensis]MEC2422448.1 tyrosine-type recombinase/integrase [Bacillus velezensis]MED3435181.1 tyrosine-type recombinase/integrase [Bacillus velezensis]MED3701266.1 tyrosine-type recombinase/integrase [Bacillus velezensis]